MNKKKLLLMAMVVMILALLAEGSFAYYTYEGRAQNVITSDGEGIDVEIVELGKNQDEFKNIEGAVPGCEYDKHVKVVNATGNAAYVRAKITVTIQKKDESEPEILTYNAESGTLGDGKLVSIDFNKDEWTYQDGWWVYNEAVKGVSEENKTPSTSNLFDHVKLGEDMDNSYQDGTVTVTVSVQAVQAANNPDKTGWPSED